LNLEDSFKALRIASELSGCRTRPLSRQSNERAAQVRRERNTKSKDEGGRMKAEG
jgi:hypothetical protein